MVVRRCRPGAADLGGRALATWRDWTPRSLGTVTSWQRAPRPPLSPSLCTTQALLSHPAKVSRWLTPRRHYSRRDSGEVASSPTSGTREMSKQDRPPGSQEQDSSPLPALHPCGHVVGPGLQLSHVCRPLPYDLTNTSSPPSLQDASWEVVGPLMAPFCFVSFIL